MRCLPCFRIDVRQILELEEDVGVADQQRALHHGPEDAGIPKNDLIEFTIFQRKLHLFVNLLSDEGLKVTSR